MGLILFLEPVQCWHLKTKKYKAALEHAIVELKPTNIHTYIHTYIHTRMSLFHVLQKQKGYHHLCLYGVVRANKTVWLLVAAAVVFIIFVW